MLRLPSGVRQISLTHLYWGKFGFKVWLEGVTPTGNPRYLTYNQRNNLDRKISEYLPTERDSYRRNFLGYSILYYFHKQEDAQSFIDSVEATVGATFKIVEVQQPDNQVHLDMLFGDNKVITRDILFHDRYEWRLKFRPLVYTERDAVRDWIKDFFEHDDKGDRFRYLDSRSTCILYLSDEADVTMAKLALSGYIRKAEKVVLLKNKNNKEGSEINESPNVLQAD